MTAQHAYKIIHWYDVVEQELGGMDQEDYIIYRTLLENLKNCHDYIPDMKQLSYHNYYLYRIHSEHSADVELNDYML